MAGRVFGSVGGRPQSLGDGAAGSGHPGAELRELGDVFSKLAGNCHHHFAGGVWRYYDIDNLSVCAHLPPGTGIKSH